MAKLDEIKERLPDYARDLRINLGVIGSSTALSPAQAWTIAGDRKFDDTLTIDHTREAAVHL